MTVDDESYTGVCWANVVAALTLYSSVTLNVRPRGPTIVNDVPSGGKLPSLSLREHPQKNVKLSRNRGDEPKRGLRSVPRRNKRRARWPHAYSKGVPINGEEKTTRETERGMKNNKKNTERKKIYSKLSPFPPACSQSMCGPCGSDRHTPENQISGEMRRHLPLAAVSPRTRLAPRGPLFPPEPDEWGGRQSARQTHSGRNKQANKTN